jgi:hypothetical protein
MRYMEELQAELNAIAEGVPAKPPDWRTTPIGNNRGGIVADVKRLSNPEWWRKPSNQAEQSLTDLLKRAGLGTMDTTDPRENHGGEKGITTNEIARRQWEKEKHLNESASKNREAHDEGESWKEYLPGPDDNVHAWYANLAKGVDVNTAERRSWFSALGSYIGKFTPKTSAGELDENVVRTMVKMICEEVAA